MAELKFLLGERQFACFAEFAGATKSEGCSVRHIYFSIQDSEASSVFDGRSVQHAGSTMTIVEGTDDDRDTAGTFEAIDALDVNGKPTQVVIEATIRVPKSTFQQLLQTQLAETVIWVHLNAFVPPRDGHGYESSNLAKARFSLIPKAPPQVTPARDYSPTLQRLFWAIVILGVAILWRLH